MSWRFLSQKMAQKEPEKWMPSTHAYATSRSAKQLLLSIHFIAQAAFFSAGGARQGGSKRRVRLAAALGLAVARGRSHVQQQGGEAARAGAGAGYGRKRAGARHRHSRTQGMVSTAWKSMSRCTRSEMYCSSSRPYISLCTLSMADWKA